MKPFGSNIQADKLINVLLFACGALALLFPFFTITLAGKTYAYSALSLLPDKPASAILLLSPCGGLLVSLIPNIRKAKLQSLILCSLGVLGTALIILAKPLVFEYGNKFSQYAWGSYLSAALCALGACHNAILLFSNKQ